MRMETGQDPKRTTKGQLVSPDLLLQEWAGRFPIEASASPYSWAGRRVKMDEIIVLLVKEIGKQVLEEATKETVKNLVKKAFESFNRNDKKKKR